MYISDLARRDPGGFAVAVVIKLLKEMLVRNLQLELLANLKSARKSMEKQRTNGATQRHPVGFGTENLESEIHTGSAVEVPFLFRKGIACIAHTVDQQNISGNSSGILYDIAISESKSIPL